MINSQSDSDCGKTGSRFVDGGRLPLPLLATPLMKTCHMTHDVLQVFFLLVLYMEHLHW